MKLQEEISQFVDRVVSRVLPRNPRLRSLVLVLIGGGIAAVAIIGPWSGAGLIAAGMEYLTLPMQRARIEAVRKEVRKVPCGVEGVAFQGVIVQAMEWNQRIAHEKVANRQWYSDPFSPDGWLGIAEIDIPDCGGDRP